MNDTHEGAQGVGNPDLSGCLSFEKYVGTTFGLEFTLGWFRFSAPKTYRPSVWGNGPGAGLAYARPGLLIDLPTRSQRFNLLIGMRTDRAQDFAALDGTGAEVDTETVAGSSIRHRVTLSSNGAPIVRVHIKGGNDEDLLLQICLDPQDLERLLEDTADVAKIDMEEIRKILRIPKPKPFSTTSCAISAAGWEGVIQALTSASDGLLTGCA